MGAKLVGGYIEKREYNNIFVLEVTNGHRNILGNN
jgi:hypothetical protein